MKQEAKPTCGHRHSWDPLGPCQHPRSDEKTIWTELELPTTSPRPGCYSVKKKSTLSRKILLFSLSCAGAKHIPPGRQTCSGIEEEAEDGMEMLLKPQEMSMEGQGDRQDTNGICCTATQPCLPSSIHYNNIRCHEVDVLPVCSINQGSYL